MVVQSEPDTRLILDEQQAMVARPEVFVDEPLEKNALEPGQ